MSDLSSTVANVLPGAAAQIAAMWPAGVEIEPGEYVYKDDSDEWQLLDANSATGSEVTRTRGVAVNHAHPGQPLAVDLLDDDLDLGATLVKGKVYVASHNPGKIKPIDDLSSGEYRVIAGVAKSTSKLVLNPSATGATD